MPVLCVHLTYLSPLPSPLSSLSPLLPLPSPPSPSSLSSSLSPSSFPSLPPSYLSSLLSHSTSRKPGQASIIKNMVMEIDKGHFEFEEFGDIHTIGSLLKKFFQDLQDALIPGEGGGRGEWEGRDSGREGGGEGVRKWL